MDYESASLYTVIASAGTFILGIIGSWFAWRRTEHSQESVFRNDILKSNLDLREEVNGLKDRVEKLEISLHEALTLTRAWELKFAQARIVLLKRHNIDLDQVMLDHEKEKAGLAAIAATSAKAATHGALMASVEARIAAEISAATTAATHVGDDKKKNEQEERNSRDDMEVVDTIEVESDGTEPKND